MADFDTSELDALARDLSVAAAKVIPAIVPVAHRAGGKIKAVMKADASGHRHLPGLASTVNYDLDTTPTTVTVDVGFRKIGQGNLANIAAFGSVNNAPVMDIIITVCDSAAGETCPIWPGHPMTAHWGIEDPAAADSADQHDAFFVAMAYLKARISLLTALPPDEIDELAFETKVKAIGRIEGATNRAEA